MSERSTSSGRVEILGANARLAVGLAIVAALSLVLGVLDALGVPLVLLEAGREPVRLEEATGPVWTALSASALVLLALWADLVRPRGLLFEQQVLRVADWVLLAAAVLTMAGAGRLAFEGAKVFYSSPWL